MYLLIYYKSGQVGYQDYGVNLDEAMQKQHELHNDNTILMSCIVSQYDTQLIQLMKE
jgi:hypothetical protein